MKSAADLIAFLNVTMSMTEVYQPVIIKELILKGGECSKNELAQALVLQDSSVIEYYRSIVMKWPKQTLSKHGYLDYQRKGERFRLNCPPMTEDERSRILTICETRISEWCRMKGDKETPSRESESIRYRVLKNAKGKCQLCGIPSSIRPIDIDHVVPRNRADKNGKIKVNGKRIHVDDESNLQALCFKCNRAKRDSDDTDFRKLQKLVRDGIPDIIRRAGRSPIVKVLAGKALEKALDDKLVEELEEYFESHSPEELADMIEVIFALASHLELSSSELLEVVDKKKKERGGFEKGYWYCGDVSPALSSAALKE